MQLGAVAKLKTQIWGYIGMILGLYRDNGKENGSYYSILGYIGVIMWHAQKPPVPAYAD